ncbi:MAG: hypothetical protein ACOX2F_07510 [bacterium]
MKHLKCECCGSGGLTYLRKEIYESNGGSYHSDLSFSGHKRFFKCSECGNVWWTDPTSEFMHLASENDKICKIITIDEQKPLSRACKIG